MSTSRPSPPAPALILGPGARMAALAPLVGALGAQGASRIEAPGELLDLPAGPGRVALDATLLGTEELGLLAEVARRAPGWELHLVGGDPSTALVRRLTASGAARWTPWPLDTETLGRWCGGVPPEATRAPVEAPRAAAAASAGPEDPTLAEIERILGAPGRVPGQGAAPRPAPVPRPAAGPPPVQPLDDDGFEELPDDRDFDSAPSEAFMVPLDAEELEALQGSPLEPFEALLPETEAPPQSPAPAPAAPTQAAPEAPARALPTAMLPAWYRDQVADLADMAQRLDLGLRRTLEASGHEETDAALESLSHDVLRLGQFTRTLGYLAAPPGANGATLDLSGLAADFLSTLASEDEAGPRFLFRGEPETRVRADKGLLVLVLDALLTVTSLAAGHGGEVRVAVEREAEQAMASIQFPAGPLEDLEPARWMEPYALHRRLPGVGPNAVAAAASILAGQGGGLELSAEGALRTFTLRLPLA